MRLLTEKYDFRIEPYQKQDGSQGKKLYLVGDGNENTYAIKDIIKKNGFRFDGYNKQWYIFLSNDNNKNNYIIDKFVKPLIDQITKIEDGGNGNRNPDDVTNDLKSRVIGQIDQVLSAPLTPSAPSSQEIQDRLQNFKAELVKITSSSEFKKRLEPIIKFRQAQGHKFSLINAILVWIQDPKATLVKAASVWTKYYNKTVIPGSPAILLWCPIPIKGQELTRYEKASIQAAFIEAVGKNSYEELTPGEKDELRIKLMGNNGNVTFRLYPSFYDIRYTKQIEGKEDVTGDPNAKVEWFSDGEENQNTERLFDALMAVIQSTGIHLSFVNDLGGAQGVSKSGKIEILDKAKKSSGTIITIVHEFAHELLHQKYLKNSNQEYAQYFIGTSQGRSAIEQQAELTAWIVMKEFNYDMPTALSYTGIWGMDESNASKVFSEVASTATLIINKLYAELGKHDNQINESYMETAPKKVNITGLDVAKMIGMEDVYQRSLDKQRDTFKKKYFSNMYDRMNNLDNAAE